MPKCFICGQELHKENTSSEHIIPNALGGHLQSEQLLCKECNSSFGEGYDAELCNQLSAISQLLLFKRDRGTYPPSIVMKNKDGEEYIIDGIKKPKLLHPIVKKELTENAETLSVHSDNDKDVKEIIDRYARKHPGLDVDSVLSKCVYSTKPIGELDIQCVIGGDKALCSVLKTALEYFLFKHSNNDVISDAINDLKNGTANRVHQIIMPPIFKVEGHATHFIFLNGDPNINKLWAIVGLFNAIQFVVSLSEEYQGNSFQSSYVYDIMERKEIQPELNEIPEFRDLPSFFYPNSIVDTSIVGLELGKVLNVGMDNRNKLHEEQIQLELNKAFTEAWEESINKLIPEGCQITENACNLFAKRYAEKIVALDKKGIIDLKEKDGAPL